MINVVADIIPGKSAAGFLLGQNLSNVLAQIGGFERWTGIPPLEEAIQSANGWLLVPKVLLSNGTQQGYSLHSERGTVELHFNAVDELIDISVFEGYQGKLFDAIQVGSKLVDAQNFVVTEYDIGDETHYPVPDEKTQGVAFYAEEDSLERLPEQLIGGISVSRTSD